MSEAIKKFKFKKKDEFEFEIFTLKSLFDRKLDHLLFKPHRANFYHLILFTKGEGRHIIDFKKYNYQTKTLMAVAENQVQQFEYSKDSDGIVMIFTNHFFYKDESDKRILQAFRIFDYALQSPLISLNENEFKFIFELFNTINEEWKLKEPNYLTEEIIRSLLRVILLKAEKLKQTEVSPTSLSLYNDFNLFREQVEKDFSRTRNVKDYAFELLMSTKKLNNLTQNVIGKTAKEFIDNRVILEIKRLLAHTNLSVQEISYQVGFDEPTNFIKFFKKYTELTPASFRKYEQK
ncbi:MAG: helix-turn-helix domain-containing protein [Spirochaetales bacterium]|nr:helix-turn-helix domain-containing protein [Spirochaetales bacterium]